MRVKNSFPSFQGYCSFGDEKTRTGPSHHAFFFILGPEIFWSKIRATQKMKIRKTRLWVVFIYVPPVFFISYFFTGSCNISSAELPYVKQIAHFLMSKHLGNFPKIFCNLFYLHEKTVVNRSYTYQFGQNPSLRNFGKKHFSQKFDQKQKFGQKSFFFSKSRNYLKRKLRFRLN